MRIGIDYRMLASPDTMKRGMGRYSQQQLREVLKLDSSNEYILFCPLYSDRSLILPEVRNAPNVAIATDPLVVDPYRLNDTKRLLAYAEQFQSWIAKHNIDVFHATAPFVLTACEADLPNFNVCPLVVTFYDLIPLLYPERYLMPEPLTKTLYLRQLQFIRKAGRFIAISQSARRDAVEYLGYPAELIDVAYPIADPCFRILSPKEARQALEKLHSRVRLPEEFMLAVSHMHFGKNIETLLHGYSLLPCALRQKLPLVAAFALNELEKQSLMELAQHYGVTKHLIATDHVTEDELTALYNLATIVVHPSRYEGFGLPVLEAMSCGAPVLTTTSSSLPEVGGNAAAYVDSEDPQAFAAAMEALCADPARRAMMRQLGLEQAKKFNGMQLARNTLASYEKAQAAWKVTGNDAKPRIAMWSPLPPIQSGVADYAAELLEKLSDQYEIELFVDNGYLPRLELLSRYTVQHYSAFERRQAAVHFEAIIYQLEASQDHFYMYQALQQWPGIAVLHDLAWGRLLYSSLVPAGQLQEFRQALSHSEGATALAEFDQSKTPSAINDFLDRHYILRQVVESSQSVLVHMESAQSELVRLYHSDKIRTIRFGVADRYRGQLGGTASVNRSQLGFSSKAFIIGLFGVIAPAKRIENVLAAFHALCRDCPEAQLLVVGPALNANYRRRIRALVKSLKLGSNIHFAGSLPIDADSDEVYTRWLLACDVVVDLLHPSRKQISRIQWQAIAAGKPLIITDLPEWRNFPDTFCLRVPANTQELEVLTEHLKHLAADADLRRTMAARARAYFENEDTMKGMAGCYQSAIREIAGADTIQPSTFQESPPSPKPMRYNKICEIEDFSDPELVQLIGAIFRHEVALAEDKLPPNTCLARYWQSAMSARAMQRFGALHSEAVVLGVGVGREVLPFYLTHYVRQVYSTDLYLDLQRWQDVESFWRLAAPHEFAPYPIDRTRLAAQHMDARMLNYPDSTFDAVFALDMLGGCGNLDLAANAAYEMGRVLKPGGVLTLTVRYCLVAPPGKKNLSNSLLFSWDTIKRHVIEASGLSPVDDLEIDLSAETINSRRDLISIADLNPVQILHDPITVQNGIAFCLVHLTLRKTDEYPMSDHHWACPTPMTLKPELSLALDPRRLQSIVALTVFRKYPAVKGESKLASQYEKIFSRVKNRARPRIYGIYVWTLNRLPRPIAMLTRRSVRMLKRSIKIFNR